MSHRALHQDETQKAKIQLGVVLQDKMRIHMSLMTMGTLGRLGVFHRNSF